ncbi:MAG TPA: hypothetical protein VK622_07615 [Puia sp.]|nr:hypothetical protein [Puia sp.]
MNDLEKTLAINIRRIFRVILGYKDKFETTSENCDYFNQAASNLIRDGLESNLPFAVSRFGHSELRALLTYIHIHEKSSDFGKILSFVKGNKVEPWWNANVIGKITHNAGLFPSEVEVIEKFCVLLLKEMGQLDVLGSWLGGEAWIKNMMPTTKFMRFHDFYHFLHEEPWTVALKDKKVLVIHPFSTSIQRQYMLRDKIFTGVHKLPDFELITYKAVQSIAGNIPTGFDDWFQALDFMKSDISKIEFDVAILGCGAYGMPLAASIKRDLKKKAIHLGGNTQILFGIKGSRWESDPNFSSIINSYWIKPLPEETPAGHQTIDSNCYW